MKKILIIGATSAIATACARGWAEEKANFFLVGRNEEKLSQVSQDLLVRGAGSAKTALMNFHAFEKYDILLNTVQEELGTIDIALIAYGTLPDQAACEQDYALTLKQISINALSVIALLTLLANRMSAQGQGTIAVISSVAGDRGRPSNYVYGASKAAVTVFCEGLRARLFKTGIHLLTIKPGFVDTPMTRDLPLPALLVVKPEKVARDIRHAILRKSDTIYTPHFWRVIMFAIRGIPSFIFKRMKI